MRKRAKRNLRMNWIIRRINILIIINYPEWDILQNGKLTAIISNPNIITWLDIFSIGLNRRSNASVIRTKNSIIGITQLLFLQKNCLIAAFNDLDAFLIPIIAQVIPNASNELEPFSRNAIPIINIIILYANSSACFSKNFFP